MDPNHSPYASSDLPSQLPNLYINRFMARPNKATIANLPLHHHLFININNNPHISNNIPLNPPTNRNPPRLPTRRRATRPLNLDPPTHHGGHIPRKSICITPRRHAGFPKVLLQAVPLLGVCGRFPDVDGAPEWTQSAQVEWAEGVWVVDV
jgi:hypothetical protein